MFTFAIDALLTVRVGHGLTETSPSSGAVFAAALVRPSDLAATKHDVVSLAAVLALAKYSLAYATTPPHSSPHSCVKVRRLTAVQGRMRPRPCEGCPL